MKHELGSEEDRKEFIEEHIKRFNLPEEALDKVYDEYVKCSRIIQKKKESEIPGLNMSVGMVGTNCKDIKSFIQELEELKKNINMREKPTETYKELLERQAKERRTFKITLQAHKGGGIVLGHKNFSCPDHDYGALKIFLDNIEEGDRIQVTLL